MDNDRGDTTGVYRPKHELVIRPGLLFSWVELISSSWLPSTFLALILIDLLFAQTVALCPSRCLCNEDSLRVSCTDSNLDLVPILLNPELIELNLSQNKITNLHYTLSFYNNLIKLDLSYNKIESLGSMNFESQHNLISLNLTHNFVKNVSKDSFKGLKNLQTLDLSFNYLLNIGGNSFTDLKQLRVFHLNNNNLISFEPDLFVHLNSLQTLILNFNQLLEIPSFNKELRRIHLSHNLIEEVGAIPGIQLEYLSLDHNLINNISQVAFDELINVKYLDLSDNNLNEMPTQQMSKLINLTILKISGNNFETIQALAFRSLFQLKSISLNRFTRLKTIDSRAFVDNVNLETIYLDSNPQLSRIPTRLFHSMTQLQHISMRNNVLETLAPDHFPLDQLTTLALSGESFVCNCSLLWLWKLVKENPNNGSKKFHFESNQIKCVFPPSTTTIQLKSVRESDITCSNQWITTITGILLLVFVLIIVSTFISYKKRFKKCLPERGCVPSNDSSGPSRPMSGPSLMYDDEMVSRPGHPGMFMYDHRQHRPLKSSSPPTPWDISFSQDCDNDYPLPPHKKPHIVFV